MTLFCYGVLLLMLGAASGVPHVESTPHSRITPDLPENDRVSAVAWSADGRYLATGTCSSTVQLWNAGSRQLLRTLRDGRRGFESYVPTTAGCPDTVTSLRFSPDGETLSAGSVGPAFAKWEVETGREIQRSSGPQPPVIINSYGPGALVSPDGKTVVSVSHDLVLWDGHTGDTLWVQALRLHPVRDQLYAFTRDSSGDLAPSIHTWNAETGQWRWHGTRVLACCLPLAVVAVFTFVLAKRRFWLRVACMFTLVLCVVLSVVFASGMSHLFGLNFWSVGPWRGGDWSCVAFSADGQTVAGAIVFGVDTSVITVWDVKTGRASHGIDCPGKVINGISYSPDGTMIASLDHQGVVTVCDFQNGSVVASLNVPRQSDSIIDPNRWVEYLDSNRIGVVNDDGIVRICDAQNGGVLHSIEPIADEMRPIMAFAPASNDSVAVTVGKEIQIVDWGVSD